MRIPPSIKKGDTIGLAAPSFGATTEPYRTRLAAAIRRFEERGYQVRAAESCYMDDGLGISTKPEKAAADLAELYLDDKISAVISVGGGELMNETISHLDFDRLREAPPKWFMGYSDNTNMIFPMAVCCDTAGIYGPCATGFGKVWEDTEKDAFAILEGSQRGFHGYPFFELPDDESRSEEPLAPYHLTEPKVLRIFLPASENPGFRPADPEEPVSFEGILLGGCLDVLENLSGTPYAPVPEFLRTHGPVIWVLEACDLNVMSIRRTLWHLRTLGWFDTAAGFIFGRPLAAFRQEFGPVNPYNAVCGPLEGLSVPVIMDADVGHVSPMLPLIIGADARVMISEENIQITYGQPD